jgi:hypothetical protein
MTSWYNNLCDPDNVQICRRSFDILKKDHWGFKPRRSIPWFPTFYAKAASIEDQGQDIKIILTKEMVVKEEAVTSSTAKVSTPILLGRMTQLSLSADDFIFTSSDVDQVGVLGKEKFLSKYSHVAIRKVIIGVDYLSEESDVCGKIVMAIEPSNEKRQRRFDDSSCYQSFEQIVQKPGARVFAMRSDEKKEVTYVPSLSDGKVYQPWPLGINDEWTSPTMYHFYLEYEDSTQSYPRSDLFGSDVVTLELSLTSEVEFYNQTENEVLLRENPTIIQGLEGEDNQGVVDSKYLGVVGIPNGWFPIKSDPVMDLVGDPLPRGNLLETQYILIPKSSCSGVVQLKELQG